MKVKLNIHIIRIIGIKLLMILFLGITIIGFASCSCTKSATLTPAYTQEQTPQLSYIALVLDEVSANKARTIAEVAIPWEGEVVYYCHHMTIAHHTNITDSLQTWAKTHEGDTFTITCTEIGYSDKALALHVTHTDVPSANAIKHITLATNSSVEGKAVDSNAITQWRTLPSPITLTGKVQFIYR